MPTSARYPETVLHPFGTVDPREVVIGEPVVVQLAETTDPDPEIPTVWAIDLTAEGWEQLGADAARAVAGLLTSAADEVDRRNTSSGAADQFDL